MNYALHLLVQFQIFALVALSLNLAYGYSGMLSLAHAAFFALGGYVYAIASLSLGLDFPAAVLVAAVFGAVASATISLPSWGLKGDLFTLATLAVGMVLAGGMTNWNDLDAPIGTLRNLTNGPYGISAIPKPSFLGWSVETPAGFAVVATAVTAAVVSVLWRLQRSPWGRLLVAMRDDELALRSLGKNTRLLKAQVLGISCGVVAVSGAVWASYVRFWEPGVAAFDESVLMLSIVIIGGAGNIRGPLMGAVFITLLPELIRLIDLPQAAAAHLRLGTYGLLLIVMMHLRPQGLFGEYRLR